jgi:hypothetical protein
MPEVITVLVGVVIGWVLKTFTETWTWRRQQVLDAYMELLDAADRYSIQVSQLWSSGRGISPETQRTVAWVDNAQEVRQAGIGAVDRAHGKLSLVSGWDGARVSGELYISCERMFRRAISIPPSSPDHYQEASIAFVRSYHDVVDQARKEMWLRHWRDRLPGRESTFEFVRRRLTELDQTDPLLGATKPAVPPHAPPTA